MSFLKKTYKLISPSMRRKVMPLSILLAVSSLLDIVSLASFVPLLLLVLDPEKVSNNGLLQVLGIEKFNDDLAYLGIGLTLVAVIFIAIKTRFQVWVAHRKAIFAYSVSNDLANRAFHNFLFLSFRTYTHTDHSKELNRITNIPLTFANNIIIPLGTVAAELIVAGLLVTTIMIYDFSLTLILFALGIPAFSIYRLQRKSIKNSSNAIKKNYPALYKAGLESVEAFSEIKVYNREDFFKRKYQAIHRSVVETFSRDHARSTGVSKITELVAAAYIAIVIVYSLLAYDNREAALLAISIFAGVSFRMIPSINRVFAAVIQMKNHEYSIDELATATQPPTTRVDIGQPINFTDRIDLVDINLSLDGNTALLKNLNLTIHKGEKILLKGRSGQGKTTLLHLLLHLLHPDSGKILVDAHLLDGTSQKSFRASIGYVPQNPFLLDATLVENIAFGIPKDEIDLQRCHYLMEKLGLSDWVSSLPQGVHTIVGEKGIRISGGQRQRIAIARALYHQPQLLLMDEFTNQLDPATELEVLHLLRDLARNITLVVVSHQLESHLYFDSEYVLKDGHLIKSPVTAFHEN